MFHIELRQFPHNLCRFNLTDADLREVTEPWGAGAVVEIGERKWSPLQARLTILEGPELPLEALSLGRGWRTAQRQGEDVTERVLGAIDEARTAAQAEVADIEQLLGAGAGALLAAWRTAAAGSHGLAPSASLALAEQALARGEGESGPTRR